MPEPIALADEVQKHVSAFKPSCPPAYSMCAWCYAQTYKAVLPQGVLFDDVRESIDAATVRHIEASSDGRLVWFALFFFLVQIMRTRLQDLGVIDDKVLRHLGLYFGVDNRFSETEMRARLELTDKVREYIDDQIANGFEELLRGIDQGLAQMRSDRANHVARDLGRYLEFLDIVRLGDPASVGAALAVLHYRLGQVLSPSTVLYQMFYNERVPS